MTVPVTAAFDIFELTSPATAIAKIKEIVCGISGTADFGDAQAEGLDVQFLKGTGTTNSGSGGTTPTGTKHEDSDPAAAVTVEASNTTVDSTATLTTMRNEPFNVQMGFRYTPPDGLEYRMAPSTRFIVRLPAGPASAFTATWHASITWEEIG
ncbi:MAG: hypothetical protein HOP14_13435 [Acidobacteria bacterium]|nr:hypothetical protein [Acidobacteriota bacterium]